MRKSLIIGGVLVILVIAGALILARKSGETKVLPAPTPIPTTNMHITSSAFTEAQHIPTEYTCDGQNINPPLTISEVPENAKSLAIIMDDLDSPNGNFVHWLIWNIGSKTDEILEGKIPPGAMEGTNSFAKKGYGGPCPTVGEHRYFFRLFALDETLSLSAGATREKLEAALQGHILARAEFYGVYKRP